MPELIYDNLTENWYTEEEFDLLLDLIDPIEYQIELWLKYG